MIALLYNRQSKWFVERKSAVSENITPIVAIIGAGPAGLYAAKQLVADGCQVVIFNRDIKPGGLAEYGIYPDKHRMKEGLRAQFRSILSSPMVSYAGNVCVGNDGDVTLEELRDMGFHAILATVGAQGDKQLGIPGEDVQGVYHAKEVVYHYNRLPPYSRRELKIGKRVAIVGVGNVMLDIARWLMDEKRVDVVMAVARRGPAEVKFDRHELEMVVSLVDMQDLTEQIKLAAPVMQAVGQDPQDALTIYSDAMPHAGQHDTPSRLTIRFLSSPRRILTDGQGGVRGLEVEATTLVQQGDAVKAAGTGVLHTLDVDTVIFAIGDTVDTNLGLPMDGNQFVKNPHSRFLVEGESYESCASAQGEQPCGVFVAGWARKASTGVVGVARRDGTRAADAIRLFLTSGVKLKNVTLAEICRKISQRLPDSINYPQIAKLEEFERLKASELGVEEFKFDTNEEMLCLMNAK